MTKIDPSRSAYNLAINEREIGKEKVCRGVKVVDIMCDQIGGLLYFERKGWRNK